MGMVVVAGFVEMNFHDTVVIQAEGFAEGVLGDLQAPIHVAAERRDKVKTNGEREIICPQGSEKRFPVGGASQRNKDLLADDGFVLASRRGE